MTSTTEHRAARWSAGTMIAVRTGPTVFGVLLIVGCSETNRYDPPPPPKVTVGHPVRREVTQYLEATGTAQPVESVDIRARVKGFLKERLYKEGAFVQRGQLLLVIDEEPFRLALDQAKLRLNEAETALRKARESQAREVARAQLALDLSQLSLAKTAQARQRSLTRRGAGTPEEMDQSDANCKKNEAQVEATRAKLVQAEADHETAILTAQANAGSARMMVRNAEIELGYCRMTAPIDGRISRVYYHVGNLVGDGQASLMATIVKTDPIFAYVSISEPDLLRYRKLIGRSAANDSPVPMELGLADEQDYPHHGHVDYQDPAVDPGTGTIRMRGIFANRDGSILPGLFVRVRIPAGRTADSLLVPERALGSDQRGRFLLVVGSDDLVEYHQVEVGARVDNLRVVVGKISEQDRVVIDGLLQARAGVKVIPVEEPQGAKSVTVAGEPARP
jgi:RND family efflux transporter MFP subunit